MNPSTSPSPPRILVDADAAPFKDDILELALRATVEVVFVCSPRHAMPEAPHAITIHVDHQNPDAADFEVVNRTRSGDIVVTQDAGLAAMLLPRGATVLSTRGYVFSPESVDRSLDRRHEIRKGKRRGRLPHGGPPALTAEDRERFRRELAAALGLES